MTVFDLRRPPAPEWTSRFTDLLSAEHEWLNAVRPDLAHSVTRRMLESVTRDDAAHLLGHRTRDDLDAAAVVAPSEWDTTHFGFAVHQLRGFTVAVNAEQPPVIARTMVNEAILPCIACAKLTMARISLGAVSELHALESAGFETMGVLVMWMRQRVADTAPSPDPCIRVATPADADALSLFARTSMREAHTHFHADRRLAADRVDQLYARWAANSVLGSEADHVVVAELDGEIAGFTAARLARNGDPSHRYGSLPLVAVASSFRGRGVGARLVNAAVGWLDAQGAIMSYVGTQANNFRAARLYTGLGFLPVHSTVSLHRWQDDQAVS